MDKKSTFRLSYESDGVMGKRESKQPSAKKEKKKINTIFLTQHNRVNKVASRLLFLLKNTIQIIVSTLLLIEDRNFCERSDVFVYE